MMQGLALCVLYLLCIYQLCIPRLLCICMYFYVCWQYGEMKIYIIAERITRVTALQYSVCVAVYRRENY